MLVNTTIHKVAGLGCWTHHTHNAGHKEISRNSKSFWAKELVLPLSLLFSTDIRDEDVTEGFRETL